MTHLEEDQTNNTPLYLSEGRRAYDVPKNTLNAPQGVAKLGDDADITAVTLQTLYGDQVTIAVGSGPKIVGKKAETEEDLSRPEAVAEAFMNSLENKLLAMSPEALLRAFENFSFTMDLEVPDGVTVEADYPFNPKTPQGKLIQRRKDFFKVEVLPHFQKKLEEWLNKYSVNFRAVGFSNQQYNDVSPLSLFYKPKSIRSVEIKNSINNREKPQFTISFEISTWIDVNTQKAFDNDHDPKRLGAIARTRQAFWVKMGE